MSIRLFNWFKPGDLAKTYPDLVPFLNDPMAKSKRNTTRHLGVNKQIIKALTFLPTHLIRVGTVKTSSIYDTELQLEIKSDSGNGRTYVLTLSVNKNESILHHECKGSSDNNLCYHAVMALIACNLYKNPDNEFSTIFRRKPFKNWAPIEILRAADELYFDMKDGIIPATTTNLINETEIGRLPFIQDLTHLLIYGVKSQVAPQESAVRIADLYETFEEAAKVALGI
nr:MAG: hypothetical protein OI720_00465 [Candidatus Methanoperedens sp.]